MAVLNPALREALSQPIRILAIGDELLRGDRVDSNSAHLASLLTDLGLVSCSIAQAPDKAGAAEHAVVEWLREGGVLVIGGGLGPTEDDATREEIARGLGVALEEHPQAMAWIRERAERMGRRFTEHTWRQALLPLGCRPIFNAQGTAPAFYLSAPGAEAGFLLVLPGVPREYRGICDELFGVAEYPRSETWRLAGMGEDTLAERLAEFPGRELLGFYPSFDGYRLRVPLLGEPGGPPPPSRERLADLLDEWLVSRAGETLESRALSILRERGETLGVAESCTAGLLGARIGDVPGASDVFLGGLISYADEVKIAQLAVPAATIAEHGAVSGETALAMARGLRETMGADWALSVTGIAGPGGERPGKPVGTIHLGLAGPGQLCATRHLRAVWDRNANRHWAVLQALTLLWRNLREVG